MATAVISASQDGFITTLGAWDDTGFWIGPADSTFTNIGLTYDLSSLFSTDAERSLPLEPPIIQSMSFRFSYSHEPLDRVIGTYFVPSFNPDDYGSGDLRPGYRNEWMIGYSTGQDGVPEYFIYSITPPTDTIAPTSYTLVGDTTMSLINNFGGSQINSSDDRNLDKNWTRFQSYIRNSQWSGKIALSLRIQVDSSETLPIRSSRHFSDPLNPELTVTYAPFHSGQMQDPKGRYRIRHDPKSGFPGNSKEFIEDGYTGLQVLPESYDPPDTTGETFQPPPSEGVVDDEVS